MNKLCSYKVEDLLVLSETKTLISPAKTMIILFIKFEYVSCLLESANSIFLINSCISALKYEDFVQMYKKCVHELIKEYITSLEVK